MAIELPNNKTARNLQEQVGYLSKVVEQLKDAFEDSDLYDKIFTLDSSSGTLTEDELAIAKLKVAFIVYNDKVYMKAQSASPDILFLAISIEAADDSYIVLSRDAIEVNESTGYYTASTSSLIETYTKDEIDILLSSVNSQLSTKANLSGANFTGAITAPSITENMSGYSFIKQTDTTSNTYNYIYAGASKTGNKLTVVLAVEVTKLANTTSGGLGHFELPSSIYTKLYPISLGGNNYLVYSKVVGVSKTDRSLIECQYSCYKDGSNRIKFTFNNANITANDTAYIRIEQTFLLSDNLAA